MSGGWPTLPFVKQTEDVPSFRVFCERMGTTNLEDKKCKSLISGREHFADAIDYPAKELMGVMSVDRKMLPIWK
jgi:hypothetical protein